MRFASLPLLLLLACLGSGCGSRPLPLNDKVEGVVRYEGVPLAGVRVDFLPESGYGRTAPSSTAMTDAEGRFELACADDKSGAVVARHRVTVVQGRRAGAGDERDAVVVGQGFRLPAVYALAAQTPLRVTVTQGQHVYDLDLKRGATPIP